MAPVSRFEEVVRLRDSFFFPVGGRLSEERASDEVRFAKRSRRAASLSYIGLPSSSGMYSLHREPVSYGLLGRETNVAKRGVTVGSPATATTNLASWSKLPICGWETSGNDTTNQRAAARTLQRRLLVEVQPDSGQAVRLQHDPNAG